VIQPAKHHDLRSYEDEDDANVVTDSRLKTMPECNTEEVEDSQMVCDDEEEE
jgi:hypothetical protein